MIALYKKGNTHTIRGIECEMGRFQNRELEARLNEGWKIKPEDLVEKRGRPKKKVEPEGEIDNAES